MKFNKKYCFKYYDNFNLYNLIKKINSDYELYFDNINKNYLIVNSAKNYQICLKFSNFNADVLKILHETKIENAQTLFNRIDLENENLKNNQIKKLINSCLLKTNEINHLAKRTNSIDIKSLNNYIEETLW